MKSSAWTDITIQEAWTRCGGCRPRRVWPTPSISRTMRSWRWRRRVRSRLLCRCTKSSTTPLLGWGVSVLVVTSLPWMVRRQATRPASTCVTPWASTWMWWPAWTSSTRRPSGYSSPSTPLQDCRQQLLTWVSCPSTIRCTVAKDMSRLPSSPRRASASREIR